MFRVKNSGVPAASIVKAALQPKKPPAHDASTLQPASLSFPKLDKSSVIEYIACPKKFYHSKVLPSLNAQKKGAAKSNTENLPISSAKLAQLQDSLEFRELSFSWDKLNHPDVVLIRESDFERAHVQTIDAVDHYFKNVFATDETKDKKIPPLTLHRPAFRALLPVKQPDGTTTTVELQSRPSVVHFYPNRREWRIYKPSAVTDPMSDKFRSEQFVHSLLFDLLILSLWPKTSSLSERSKQFLTFSDHHSAGPEEGQSCRSTSVPFMDPDKCGVLSIRPYVSGPVTLQHHDTYSLQHFVQKTTLTDLVAKLQPRTKNASPDDSQPTWLLSSGLTAMEGHVLNAASTLLGVIDKERLACWSALSSNSSGNRNFVDLVSSVCRKDSVDCPLFSAGNCLPMKSDVPSTFDIPGMTIDKKVALWKANIETIDQLVAKPKAAKSKKSVAPTSTEVTVNLNDAQQRFITSKLCNAPIVNPKAVDDWLASIQYPAFFLDFEAVQFALPPFEQCKPYQAIPFQFSMDVFHENVLTEEPVHYDFLFLEEQSCQWYEDPRPKCIEQLFNAIRAERAVARKRYEESKKSIPLPPATDEDNDDGDLVKGKAKKVLKGASKGLYRSENRRIQLHPWDGMVVAHFAGFERNVLLKASHALPQFKTEISNLTFLDTIDLVKASLTHPAARGSTSLKKLVPALLGNDNQYGAFDRVSFGNEADEASANSNAESADGSTAAALYRLWRHRGGVANNPLVSELERGKKEIEQLGWARVRQQLLEYCNADTRNMYLVVRAVHKIAMESIARGDQYDKEGWSILSPSKPIAPQRAAKQHAMEKTSTDAAVEETSKKGTMTAAKRRQTKK